MVERLALIEWIDADGQVRQRDALTRWPVTLGRSLGCDVVFDHPQVAALHATLADGPDGLRVTVGETRNGVRIGGRRLRAGEEAALPTGGDWQLGPLTLRVRLAREALAPEAPIDGSPGRPWAGGATWVLMLAASGWLAFETWLGVEPGATWDAYVLPLLAAAGIAATWGAVWGVASKLFRRHFEFGPHLRLLLGYGLAAAAADGLLALAAYSFSAPALSGLRLWVALGFATALLAAHLARVLPARRRALRTGAAALLVLGIGVDAALNIQREQRWSPELYMATLPGPAWRLAPARPPQALVDQLQALHPQLEREARQAAQDDRPGPEDDSDGGE